MPSAINAEATITSWICGIPGISAIINSSMPPIRNACGCARNWEETSVFRLPSDTERVTIIPVEVEISSAGIWETSPSPMVAMEYICNTAVNSMPPCTTPIIVPATKLIVVMIIDMIASPFTILVAPSIAP